MQKSAFMEACQLTRKETKMETVHLKQDEVAARWNVSVATLERWRSEGIGPKFLKIGGLVRYREVDIVAFELSCLATSTQSRVIHTMQPLDLEGRLTDQTGTQAMLSLTTRTRL